MLGFSNKMFKSLKLEIEKKKTIKNCSGGHYKKPDSKYFTFDMVHSSKMLSWLKDSEEGSGFRFFTTS